MNFFIELIVFYATLEPSLNFLTNLKYIFTALRAIYKFFTEPIMFCAIIEPSINFLVNLKIFFSAQSDL